MADGFMRIYRAWRENSLAVTIPFVMIPIGVAALILGDGVSRAFADVGGGTVVRNMGAAMLIGGVLVATSVILDDATFEVMGLAFGIFGTIVYGLGVLLGLRTQGLVTGPENLGIAFAFMGRIALLLRRARAKTSDEH